MSDNEHEIDGVYETHRFGPVGGKDMIGRAKQREASVKEVREMAQIAAFDALELPDDWDRDDMANAVADSILSALDTAGYAVVPKSSGDVPIEMGRGSGCIVLKPRPQRM